MRTIDDMAVAGKRVLVRADLNVPLDGGWVADDTRITASLPTLIALTSLGAKVIICAHLGRPQGEPDLKYSLAPVAVRLSELLGRRVELAADTVGPSAHAAIAALRPAHWGRPAALRGGTRRGQGHRQARRDRQPDHHG